MKKNGKKYRKLQKINEQKKEENLKNAGKPYSKHKIKICYHYDTTIGFKGGTYSFLEAIYPNKCCCSKCKQEFSIDFYYKMIRYLTRYARLDNLKYHEKIHKKIKPVCYYYVEEDVVNYLDEKEAMAYVGETDKYKCLKCGKSLKYIESISNTIRGEEICGELICKRCNRSKGASMKETRADYRRSQKDDKETRKELMNLAKFILRGK